MNVQMFKKLSKTKLRKQFQCSYLMCSIYEFSKKEK